MTQEIPSDEHFAGTNYKYQRATPLVNYISRDDMELKNRVGQDMTEDERDVFRKRSEHYGFTRHYVLSAADECYDDEEIGRATRKSVNNWFDGDTVDFCYSVHRDTDSTHAHVVLTGDRDDLALFPEDIEPFREQSEEKFLEQKQDLEQELMQENDLEQEQEQQQSRGISR